MCTLKKKRLKYAEYFFSLTFLVFLCSCATNHSYISKIESQVMQSDYETALSMIDEKENELYSSKDSVLLSLDRGMLSHYSGNFKQSNEALSSAENLMFEYFSKSISQSIQSFIINDTVIDYAGDPYEDIYTNIFMALNYIALGEIDEAMVEIRRFDTKQKNLVSEYALAQSRANENKKTEKYFGNASFHNSALARYLSMLLYRTDGNNDAAEIDLRYLKTAFRDQAQLYPFSLPASLDEELQNFSTLARLNVLAFTGLAPIKKEEVIRFYSDETYFKLALPIMLSRPSNVAAVDFAVENVETGERFHFRLETLEQIELIAFDTFKQKQDLLYFKAIARAFTKSLTTGILDSAGQNNGGSLFGLLAIVSAVSNELTEIADLRTSRYFPARASIGGISLEPGNYNFKIDYINNWGNILKTDYIYDYLVYKNKLNLVEVICLQ